MSLNAQVDHPVLWHEGMLLTPQHFQQHDLYWHQLLRHQMEQLQPFYWGLLELKIDSARLEEGVVQVDRLRAVLPDGLVVVYGLGEGPRNDNARLSLDLSHEPSLKAKSRSRVYLTVPLHGEGAASDRAPIRRFDSFVGPATVDANTGEDPYAVLRLRPRLTLSAGIAAPPNTVAMPILEVERNAMGHTVLTGYHPPLLQLGASAFLADGSLQRVLEELLRKFRRKASRLSVMRSNRHKNLFALAAALPKLETLVFTECCHPFEIYKALADLVGHAAGLQQDGIPPLLPRYQHDQIATVFTEATSYLEKLVDNLELEFEISEFELRESDCFCIGIDSTWQRDEIVVELMPGSDQTGRTFHDWLTDARIGSESLHEVLVQQRSPGAWWDRLEPPHKTQYTHRPDAQLYVLRNRTLQLHDRSVPVIAPGELLVIRGSGRFPSPARILLYEPQKFDRTKEHTTR